MTGGMNTTNRALPVNKLRDAWVEINLSNLEYNINSIKEKLKEKLSVQNDKDLPDLMAVIKADGYGHGSLACAPVLTACGVNAFGVASVDEGLELRNNKITSPILVLGTVPIWAFESAAKNNITVSIFNKDHIEAAKILYDRTKMKLKAHVKVETGMNRIGISHKKAADFIKEIQNADFIDLKGVFTHFADVENINILNEQKKNFKKVIDEINTENLTIHCQNSLGAFIDPGVKCDMIRLGIILYGLTPITYGSNCDISLPKLKPVMGLKGRITNIHTIEKDEGVSYGHTYIAKKETRVATIPIGYADGVSRNLSNRIFASLNGKMIKQIGRITMDQMMFDITGLDAKVGDVITLLGKDENDYYSVDEWAKILNTINYELTCRLKVRLARIYVR